MRDVLYKIGFLIWGVALMWFFILATIVVMSFLAHCARADDDYDLYIPAAIKDTAKLYDLDPKLVEAVIEVESGFNKNAIGTSGERGLMQLHPRIFKDPRFIEPVTNILYGTMHLAEMRRLCGKKLMRAGHPYTWVVCYNNGPYRSPKHPELHPYYKKVMAAYSKRVGK